MVSYFKFFFFLIKIQWKDRLATAAFLIGVTIQTFLLCLSILKASTSYHHGLILAIRSSLLTSIGATLFSSMSNIQNEFRFGTVESICLSKFTFNKLIIFRCLSMGIICSPAILFPFLMVVLKYPQFISINFFIVILSIYVSIIIIGIQTTYVLNFFKNPVTAIPWLKFIILVIGLELTRLSYFDTFAILLPFHWIIQFVNMNYDERNIFYFLLTMCLSMFFTVLIFRRNLDEKIADNYLKGRVI